MIIFHVVLFILPSVQASTSSCKRKYFLCKVKPRLHDVVLQNIVMSKLAKTVSQYKPYGSSDMTKWLLVVTNNRCG